jgi:bifunctional enzyme CysN/CysC
VLLVDARKGVLTQTRRHSYIVSLLGIRDVILAVNKMDLVAFSSDRFAGIERDYLDFADRIGLHHVTCIPVCAVDGDNVVVTSPRMPWYNGPALLTQLENVDVAADLTLKPFRMPVQWVARTGDEFRGYTGLIVSGTIGLNDAICVAAGRSHTRIVKILVGDRERVRAVAGQSVTLTLADEIDVSRGDVLAAADAVPSSADAFEGSIVWLHDKPMLPGRTYVMKLSTQTVSGTIAPLKYRLDVNSLKHLAARKLDMNEIIIDPLTNETVGAALLHFALRRSENVQWQMLDVSKRSRADRLGQTPCVFWFTGLSGAGKSTIANLMEKRLQALGRHTYLLDGDIVRHGLNKDLGFTDADRVENIRRVAEVARLMVDAGLIVLVALISPFRAERQMARSLFAAGEFVEIFVDAPLAVAEQRDPKGLYKKARRGDLKNFTGIDSPYEPPEAPEIHLHSAEQSAEEAADVIVEHLRRATGVGGDS